MRIHIPSRTIRARVIELLDSYYERYQDYDFEAAIAILSDWYRIKPPKVTFFKYIDAGTTGGQVLEDGRIELQHPEEWRKSKSRTQGKRKWVRTVIHEFAHYYLWANAEEKAQLFERRFIHGARREQKGD